MHPSLPGQRRMQRVYPSLANLSQDSLRASDESHFKKKMAGTTSRVAEEYTFKWSKEQTAQFIKLRGENDSLFNGAKNSASAAWRTILEKIGLLGKRLQEDGPEPGLHHPKSTLYNGACPGMMAVEALGSHTLYWPLVGRDEGEWVFEARVPSVCEDKVPCRRVE
ncbi:hypothetical protein MATL_G00133710 [Megalops atlanticus]|uniref:Uncharacterized protein n=1 Tax=Megalops atlanticus TaxID=7932 RepID=A0A9D3PWX3_MEGAT|nr:hypothetical protein MATL_G00133710 [Megalops atlanticus]